MKALLIIAIALSTTSAFAAVKCPTGSRQIEVCTSTPQEGDNVVAGNMFESIKVCEDKQDDKIIMVYAAPNGESEAVESKEIVRPGGTTYVSSNSDIITSLSITKGVRPGSSKENNATFSFKLNHVSEQLGALSFASTYSCK
jgi:hypothetical protein